MAVSGPSVLSALGQNTPWTIAVVQATVVLMAVGLAGIDCQKAQAGGLSGLRDSLTGTPPPSRIPFACCSVRQCVIPANSKITTCITFFSQEFFPLF